MTTRPRFSCCLRRRHFERISEMVMFAESSTYRGAALMREEVSATFCHSLLFILPACILDRRTPDSAESIRIAISCELISSEKMSDVMPCFMDAERQKSRASVDLPIAGRAATMIIWPPCRPWVSSSRSVKPVGTPLSLPWFFSMSSRAMRISVLIVSMDT